MAKKNKPPRSLAEWVGILLFYLVETFFIPIFILLSAITSIVFSMELAPVKRAYTVVQWGLDKLLSPNPPPPHATLRRPKIAIIGAGLTGVSAAAHCVGHGFDVQIFEAGDEGNLGGIWAVSLLSAYPIGLLIGT